MLGLIFTLLYFTLLYSKISVGSTDLQPANKDGIS